jgi:EF hand
MGNPARCHARVCASPGAAVYASSHDQRAIAPRLRVLNPVVIPIACRLALLVAAVFGLGITIPRITAAQDPSSPQAQAKARFRQLDQNESGWLSGRELAACDCRAYDLNGDGEVNWEEFSRGEQNAGGARSGASVALQPANATAEGAAPGEYRIGDRVMWDLGGIEYAGTIYSAEAGKYQIERDGYGRAREWVSPTELRRLSRAATPNGAQRQPAAGPATVTTNNRFHPGDRVEMNIDGAWYAATVSNAVDARYHVVRDDRTFGVASSEEWIAENRLRPLASKPAAAAPPTGALPQALPAGLYTCMTYQTGGGANVGKLRILGDGQSSGVTPDGAGPQRRFSYDATSGAIGWTPALQIVGFTVERAEYRPSNGRPNINLHYRARAGGNLNSMYCLQ